MQSRTGTSQKQRELQTLLMDTFQIDNRSSEELMMYVYSYFSNVFYYNENDKIDGTWDEVFSDSGIFYMIKIITADFSSLQKTVSSYEEAVQIIQQWDETVKSWPANLELLGETELAGRINSLLQDEIYASQIKLIDPNHLVIGNRYKGIKEKKNSKLFSMPQPSFNDTDNEDVVDVNNLKNIYTKLVDYISKMTSEYLEKSIFSNHNHRPDVSLFMSFIELFKNAQNSINTLSKRHLDFYYQDVLKVELASGKATNATVSFQLLPNITSSTIDTGALLSAGKLFNSTVDVLFETSKSIQLLNTNINQVKTIFFNRNPYIDVGTDQNIVSGINLTNLNILQGGLTAPDGSIPAIFGGNKQEILNPDVNPIDIAEIGFLISSPTLFLSEGLRVIKLIFTFDQDTADIFLWSLLDQMQQDSKNNFDVVFEEVFDQAFNISYTTVNGWQSLSSYSATYDRTVNSITLSITLGLTDPAMDFFSDESNMSLPAFKVDLNPYASTYCYSFLSGVIMKKIEIEVEVKGMKDLSVYSNAGKVVPSKSFDLFGPIPQQYNYLMLSKAEIFKKQVLEVDVQLQWAYVPADYGGFDTYYAGYSNSYTNESFKVLPTILSAGVWLPSNPAEAPEQLLFDTVACTTPQGYQSVQLSWNKTLSIENFNQLGISRDYTLVDPVLYTLKTQSGFIKFTFTEPVQAFGAQDYVNDYSTVARYNATNDPKLPYPNRPFVPKVASISMDYKAYDMLNFDRTFSGDTNAAINAGEFKQITPFGLYDVLYKKAISFDTSIIPAFSSQGYLLILLENVQYPSIISAFFYLKSSGNTTSENQVGIQWEYKQYQDWIPIEKENIINDGTQNFIKSGIIEILLPDNGSADQQAYWLRVSPQGNAEKFPNLAGIYFNSLEVSCTSTDPNVIGKVVPAGSITSMSGLYPDIKSVLQPVDSQNGRLVENQFYQRTRERLRHKQRAITLWDYEHLVLEQFPDVGIVKCTNLDTSFKAQPNNMKLVVMSKFWTFENQLYLNLDQLANITSFVKSISNAFCKIVTMNPVSETLLVNCLVTFDPEDVGGYYINKLNQEIINFLSPDSKLNLGNMGIGNTVVPQMLTSYLEKLPYIKSIDKLYIEQIIAKDQAKYSLGVFSGGNVIRCTTDWSILMPATEHNIYLKGKSADFSQNVGISTMELGIDFILGKPEDDIKAGVPFISINEPEQPVGKINAVLFINDNDL